MTRHGTKKIQIDMVSFRRDVEAGASPMILSEKYGCSKATIYKLKCELSGKIARREDVPNTQDADAPEAFDITLNVPADRLDDLLTAASDEELRSAVMLLDPAPKAQLFQAIFQASLDRALNPGVELPHLMVSAAS